MRVTFRSRERENGANYKLKQIRQRATHCTPTTLDDMGINLRRFHVAMPQLFLNGPNIRPAFQQVGCE